MNAAELTPVDWAKRPVQKYADFSGRAPRAEFWWYVLAVIIVTVIAQIIDSIIGMKVAGPYGPLSLLVLLGLLVPNIAVSVRRLHDTNRTGWWILAPIVPYILAFVLGSAAMLGAAGSGSSAGMAAGMGIAGLFMLACLAALVALLVFYCMPGTAGENRYGADPYGGSGAAVAAE